MKEDVPPSTQKSWQEVWQKVGVSNVMQISKELQEFVVKTGFIVVRCKIKSKASNIPAFINGDHYKTTKRF